MHTAENLRNFMCFIVIGPNAPGEAKMFGFLWQGKGSGEASTQQKARDFRPGLMSQKFCVDQ
jgi:hypothetical protein